MAVLVIQTLPVFMVKPLGAKEYANKDVAVYYQPGDEAGAREIFELVTNNIAEIKARMKYESNKPLEIYVYKTQFSLAIREVGFVTLLFAPSWFIGDSEQGVIRMVSPNTKVKGHTHDTILNGTLHEVVHSINYYKNPRLSYFWDNGLATYVAKQVPDRARLSCASLPSFEDLQTNNGLKFGNMGGYAYSYSYVEYLDKAYGWDSVIAFASGEKDYQQAFGKSERQIYANWGSTSSNRTEPLQRPARSLRRWAFPAMRAMLRRCTLTRRQRQARRIALSFTASRSLIRVHTLSSGTWNE